MKATVFGGAGFLGRHIVNKLSKMGYFIKVLDTNTSNRINAKNIEYIKGSILDDKAIKKALEGSNVVFHLAALADIDRSSKEPINTIDINIGGLVRCLDAASKLGVKRFIYASSVYVTGTMGSFYRVSKLAGEELCKVYHEEYGLPYSIVRYGSLYGEDANEWNFISRICKQLIENKKYVYYGNGKEIREFIHIVDAAEGSIKVSRDEKFENKTVLITGHQKMNMEEFFELVKEIMNGEIEIRYSMDIEYRERHYNVTPYRFQPEVPLRINMDQYIDINEGIIACLAKAKENLESRYEKKTV
ncbi:MAG: NAD-dependent epimerase/dehydratase family protein [Patescibacteria group bacterium]